jgi:thymidylate synthase ThyX
MKTTKELNDLGLYCHTVSAMSNPGIISYAAAIQDYSEGNVYEDMFKPDGNCWVRDPKNPGKCLTEEEAQRRIIDRCLSHKHWGVIEHPQIVVNFVGFPHSMMQQLRTHRTGLCVSGDTLVRYSPNCVGKGEKNKEKKISEIYSLWTNGRSHQSTQNDAAYMKRKLSKVNILIGDLENKGVKYSNISNVYSNGVKEVFQVTTKRGFNIKTTLDHLFYTPMGWKQLRDLKVGDNTYIVNKAGSKTEPFMVKHDLKNEVWKEVEGFPFYQISNKGRVMSFMPKGGKQKNKEPKKIGILKPPSKAKNYLFVSLSPFPGASESLRFNVHWLVAKAFCPNYKEGLEVRHLDGNSYNNSSDNLSWGTSKENSEDLVKINRQMKSRMVEDTIVSIEPKGEEETFDLEVTDPSHNYVGNGFVIHNSFDVQSGRYSGQRIVKVAKNEKPIDEVFFFRPAGIYQDRGKRHAWTQADIQEAEINAYGQCVKYAHKVEQGMPYEMARDLYISYGVRQNFVMSCNLRTAFHLLDMRNKGDAEIEIQWAMHLFMDRIKEWVPLITEFYEESRARKNLIAP